MVQETPWLPVEISIVGNTEFGTQSLKFSIQKKLMLLLKKKTPARSTSSNLSKYSRQLKFRIYYSKKPYNAASIGTLNIYTKENIYTRIQF